MLFVKFATMVACPCPGENCLAVNVLDLPFPMDLDLVVFFLLFDPLVVIPLPLPLLPFIMLPCSPFPFIIVFLLLGVVGVSLIDGSVVVDGVWMLCGGFLGGVVGTFISVGAFIGDVMIGALVVCDVGALGIFGCVVGVTTGSVIVGEGAALGAKFVDGDVGSAVGVLSGRGSGMSVS